MITLRKNARIGTHSLKTRSMHILCNKEISKLKFMTIEKTSKTKSKNGETKDAERS